MGERDEHDAYDIAWSRQQFRLIAEGGTWTVPRSGLVFQKRGEELVLIRKLPSLFEGQDEDYETIREKFEQAGITVRSEA